MKTQLTTQHVLSWVSQAYKIALIEQSYHSSKTSNYIKNGLAAVE